MAKKYRVNGTELFNLQSMHTHLKCIEIDMEEGTIPWSDEVEERIAEVESLMDKAYCIGCLVDWPTLKRIREIKDERQLIRYIVCLSSGASEREAAQAFEL